MKFRRATPEDLKIGQFYIVRYAGHSSDIECVRANNRYGIQMLRKIEHIEGDRIAFGPPGSSGAMSGLNIGDALIPTDQEVISDYLLWDEILKRNEKKHPFRGTTADQEVDWSYKMDRLSIKEFLKTKRTTPVIKLKELSKGDKLICTLDCTNIMGNIFFIKGVEYPIYDIGKEVVFHEYKKCGVKLDGRIKMSISQINHYFIKSNPVSSSLVPVENKKVSTKTVEESSLKELNNFSDLMESVMKYLDKYWEIQAKPKDYDKYLETYQEYDQEDIKYEFDGPLDTSATCDPFPYRISRSNVAYGDTQQRRTPTQALIGAVFAYGLNIGAQRQKINTEDMWVIQSARDNLKYFLEERLTREELREITESSVRIIDLKYPNLKK